MENGIAREVKNARRREWETSAGRVQSLLEQLQLLLERGHHELVLQVLQKA